MGQAKAIDAMSDRRKRKAEAKGEATEESPIAAAAAVARAAAGAGSAAAAKRQKRAPEAGGAGGAAAESADGGEGLRQVRRRFKQRQPIYESGGSDGRQVDVGLLKSVLGKNV